MNTDHGSGPKRRARAAMRSARSVIGPGWARDRTEGRGISRSRWARSPKRAKISG